MTWLEVIQKRRLKEAIATSPFDAQISADVYQHAIGMALSKLNGLERAVICARFGDGLPIARIADRLSMSWDGADALIDRAVEKIRNGLTGLRVEYRSRKKEEIYEVHQTHR